MAKVGGMPQRWGVGRAVVNRRGDDDDDDAARGMPWEKHSAE